MVGRGWSSSLAQRSKRRSSEPSSAIRGFKSRSDRKGSLVTISQPAPTVSGADWDGHYRDRDKTRDDRVDAPNDSSISVRALANQTIFMDWIYRSVVFAQDDGRLTLYHESNPTFAT